MLTRKRWRSLLCQLHILMFILGFLFFLVIVALLDPEAQSEGNDRNMHHQGRGEYIWAGGGALLESGEQSNQYRVEVLSPLSSLRDEGLIAIGVSDSRRNLGKVRRKLYRIVRQPRKKNEDLTTLVPQSVVVLDTQGVNEDASQKVPLRRRVPEGRHPLCLQENYNEKLPTASVIISFNNEAWSTLLRTVHSVLDTSPRKYLKEIILVDDLSNHEHLKSALSEYIARLGGVKLIRSNKRLGVVGGRMLGAARATGDILIFMDSHCECHSGWLEPLLSRIMNSRNCVVSPVLDVIDWRTFDYHHSADLRQGVFDWKLDFHWVTLPEREEKVRQSPIIPFRSPVIPGCVIAVDRHYFQNIGAFDMGMTFWGAESTELSIRVWLCGGLVEIVPCSRVGHVYRNQGTYTSLHYEAELRNKIRIAEVWMDSYKYMFYKHNEKALNQTTDITERQQLQIRLGCKRFEWFLANIYPEINSSLILESAGQLLNSGFGSCMNYEYNQGVSGQLVYLSNCENKINQLFEYNNMKEIRFAASLCLDGRHEQIILENCTATEHHNQRWDFNEDGLLIHVYTGKCIEAISSEMGTSLYLRTCNNQRNQIWKILHQY
ncbi:polypeptide N-acetylgalactosaminyltransferase 15 [Bombina bombina]|uniref:polypeptide N-acetylgalactosaminyltransferase 15 n=1 Tax=Bombina bombina TaxID=8345 RepID=UPI00235AA6DC|nr:polypeptide N-acetylgalactosaminyltransferase 15 [Bombina bombina]